MILFPWLLLVATLLIITIGILESPEAWRHFRQERRLYAQRPATRLVVAILTVEVIAIVIWVVVLAVSGA
jgi:hypothetical protein